MLVVPLSQDTLELNPDVSTTTARFEFWPILVAVGVAIIFIVIAIIALWAVSHVLTPASAYTQHVTRMICSIATSVL